MTHDMHLLLVVVVFEFGCFVCLRCTVVCAGSWVAIKHCFVSKVYIRTVSHCGLVLDA